MQKALKTINSQLLDVLQIRQDKDIINNYRAMPI